MNWNQQQKCIFYNILLSGPLKQFKRAAFFQSQTGSRKSEASFLFLGLILLKITKFKDFSRGTVIFKVFQVE